MGKAVDSALKALVEAIKSEMAPAKKSVPAVAAKPVVKPAKADKALAAGDGYKMLKPSDKIKKGDEWRLKHGLHHGDGRKPRWRKVDDAIGSKVSDFDKSMFRRPVQ